MTFLLSGIGDQKAGSKALAFSFANLNILYAGVFALHLRLLLYFSTFCRPKTLQLPIESYNRTAREPDEG
jgi:hypothetical protein